MTPLNIAQRMEETVREYIRACNAADASAIAVFFTPDATHYFPQHGKSTGASTIAQNFAKIVVDRGISWTVDKVVADVAHWEAVMEWTQFTKSSKQMVRGIDWLTFEPSTLRILEVRCYFAANWPAEARQELKDFDYAGRGYPTTFPDQTESR